MPRVYVKILLIFLAFSSVSFLILASFPRSFVKVFDQPKGPSIKVEEFGLAKDGFIVVAASSPERFFVLGEVPRGSDYLPAGRYKDFWIPFREPVEEVDIPDYVLVGIFLDNGDGFFEGEVDKMVEVKRIKLY